MDKITFSLPLTDPEVPSPQVLEPLLEESAARHQHLCPRQVLGVRMALRGLVELGFIGRDYQPRFDNTQKRLLTIVETDGCAADGIGVASACSVGRRTLRVLDYGKVAATLVDTAMDRAVRIIPAADSRQLALDYCPDAESPWHAYREGYRLIPDGRLLAWMPVTLTRSIAELVSRPEVRAICQACREEIMNERELLRDGEVLCWSCAHGRYYIGL